MNDNERGLYYLLFFFSPHFLRKIEIQGNSYVSHLHLDSAHFYYTA